MNVERGMKRVNMVVAIVAAVVVLWNGLDETLLMPEEEEYIWLFLVFCFACAAVAFLTVYYVLKGILKMVLWIVAGFRHDPARPGGEDKPAASSVKMDTPDHETNERPNP